MKITIWFAGLALMLAGFGRAYAQEGNVWFSDGSEDDQIMAFNEGPMDEEFEVVIESDDDMDMMMPDLPMGQMPDELKLTPEQKDKIEAIHTSAKKTAIPLKADLDLKRIELRELMRVDNPDKAKITAKVREMESLHTQLKLNRINTQLDVRTVLTKEQREKMKEMRFNGKRHIRKFIHGPEYGPGMMDDDDAGQGRKFRWKEKGN
ncbi:MAG: Spy/CpxP family protein refolding chaperone [Bacteroidetes bacterium]|nr:Spy/CpxP family protein refolding chaperone [Bacteroidota bacterium]